VLGAEVGLRERDGELSSPDEGYCGEDGYGDDLTFGEDGYCDDLTDGDIDFDGDELEGFTLGLNGADVGDFVGLLETGFRLG